MSSQQTDEQSAAIGALAERARSAHRTIEELVVWAIREAILTGVFAPGEKLPQEALAHAFGVSRIPIRVAARQLAAEGLLELHPNRGAFVRSLTPTEIDEIYELRIVLETFALRAAAKAATPAAIDRLTDLAERIDRSSEGEEFVELRARFYDTLYGMSGLTRTAEMIAGLRADVGRYWLSLRVAGADDGAHRVIVDAIRAGDAASAEMWLQEHLRKVSAELQARVRGQGSVT